MGVADSAVGAILEIPDKALNDILKAQRYIENLQMTSKNAADDVAKHWGETAVGGLEKFIQSLSDAQNKMKGWSAPEINIKPMQQSMQTAANVTESEAEKISKALQSIAAMPVDTSNLKALEEQVQRNGWVFKQLEDLVKNYESGRQVTVPGMPDAQAMNNAIEKLKEFIALRKMSNEQLTAKSQREAENTILAEQKNLISQILQIQKDINRETTNQTRSEKLGKAIPQEDIDRLRNYESELARLGEAYGRLKEKINEMSESGQRRFNVADINAELAMTREMTTAEEKRNQVLQQTAKLTSETKLKSAGISSREESVYQNELVAVYQQMIRLIKLKGETEATVAASGKSMTDAQRDYIQTLANEYTRLENTLTQLSGKYTEIDQKAKSNFENTKTIQEAENAAKLADAYQKAADAAEKKRKAEAKSENTDLSKDKSEYKQILTLIENMEKAWNKMKTALETTNLPDALRNQLQSQIQSAETALNNLYQRKAEIESKRGEELAQIQNQSEAKKGAAAVAEFEKAEKEKTRIAKQEATDRHNEEMRQQRLTNAQLVETQRKQRMGITAAKEQRDIELYQQKQKEIERLRQEIAALDKADKDYQKNLDRLNQRINELLGSSQRRVNYTQEEAMSLAKNARTLRELETAYKALKDAMANTDPKKDAEKWRDMNTQLQKTKTEIDKIKSAMGEMNNQSKNLGNQMGQLKNLIAGAFSVSAIQGFIKKMVETRAQFELQRVALGAIIQDTDRANKMFLEVQQMALMSPFSIMQLERATKQVAAFGFETEKIVPTLKMVADLGAGLGVELDRIVLVMGHLKARGYLEGTMVRQFTNMGFNVLGELAKYYTELEDKMVSVADVQTRVKKKMVEFADVEEVLKRVTSAGGMFYDMQKKQAESLYGQLQRITDAYDLMLNEIGKDNTNMISKALTAIRSLINHWRMLAPTLKAIGYLMAGVIAVKGIIALGWQLNKLGIIIQTLATQWRLVGVAANKAATSMKLAWSSTGIGLLIAGLVTAISYFAGVRAEAKALKEELDRIGNDSVNNLNNAIVTFKTNADKISDTSNNYLERAEAMKEINRVFADILPKEKMEIDYITNLKGNYEELIDTIQEYYQTKEYQQKYETVLASKQAKDVSDEIERVFKRMNKNEDLGMVFPESQLKAWAEKVATELNTGKIPNSLYDLKMKVREIFPDASDIDRYLYETYGQADFTDVVDKVDKVRDAFGDISLATSNATNALAMYDEQLRKMDFDQLTNETEKQQQRLQEIAKEIQQTKDLINSQSYQDANTTAQAQLQQRLESLNKQYAEQAKRLSDIDEAKIRVAANEFYKEVDTEIKSFTGLIEKYWECKVKMGDLEKQGKKNSEEYKKLAKEQDDCKKSADKLKVKFTEVDWTLVDNAKTSYELKGAVDDLANEAFPNVAKRVSDAMDSVKKMLAQGSVWAYKFATAVADMLPDNLKKKLPDFAGKLKLAESELEVLEGKAKNTAKNVDDAAVKAVSESTSRNVEKFGARMERINNITKDTSKSSKDLATELRNEAKGWEETTKAYDNSTNKEVFLAKAGLTETEIAQMKKDAQAANAIADEIYGKEEKENKTGKGTDPWQKRVQLFKELNTEYEKLLQNYSKEEAKQRIQQSYAQAIAEIYKGLGKFAKADYWPGFDKESMITLGQEMLDTLQISPEKRKDLEKELAGLKATIDVQIQKDAVENMKKDIQSVADNFELSETFRKLGVSTDLVFMLGGKPTTLEEYKQYLVDTYEEAVKDEEKYGKEGAKAYEELLKQIEQKEKKSLEERAKNYAKYLKSMYSDRAKLMIESYSTMMQMEKDFQKNIQTLQAEMNNPETSDARKKELAEMIESLQNQMSEVSRGMKNELNQNLAKLDWNDFKGSDIFTQMYQDVSMLSNKGIDALIERLKTMRSTLQSMENVDAKSVKEITTYIEKLQDAKAEKSPFTMFNDGIASIKLLKKEYDSLAEAQVKLIELNDTIKTDSNEVADLETIIGLKDKEGGIEANLGELNEHQLELYNKHKDSLNSQLAAAREKLAAEKNEASTLSRNLDNANKTKKAYEKQVSQLKQLETEILQCVDAAFEMMDAFGLDVDDEWKQLTTTLVSATIQAIMLQLQLKMIQAMGPAIGAAMNSALGVIGWIATGLQVVASLFTAIFAAHDKSLQKQIDKIQDQVDALSDAFEDLEDAMEKAFGFSDYNQDFDAAQRNLEQQKKDYQEMIRLEEEKKHTDDDKIKDWTDKIKEIEEAEEELYEKRHEKYGSVNNVWDEANDWVDAWLDAYKEAGDGLDALNDSWDEFYENLIKKQAVSKVLGSRMDEWISEINDAIDENMNSEYDYIDEFKRIGEGMKSEFEEVNADLLKIFEYAGIGTSGESVLSDLQKGIQNITEPQAAAIEAYLNSMRFAVFRHTEQLDTLIATISAQYGTGENPMLVEVKGIRSVLDDIYSSLKSVMKTQAGKTYIQVG